MHIKYIAKNLGSMLLLFSFTMLPPVFLGLHYQEETVTAFFVSWCLIFGAGICLWLPLRHEKYEPRIREGFLIVVIYWFFLCIIGGMPFYISENPDIPYIDAFFESVSGLTATGATVFTQLDIMPMSIIYYRQQLQFLGGMGILLLAVAILPTLGVGGMQLFRAEITGPHKDSKLTPKIAETAKSLWLIYVSLAALCILAYWAAGMSWFDAVCYSFGTVSTGGFAPHDNSIGFFHTPNIKIISIVFMSLGAMNFSLHYFAIRQTSLALYKKNSELFVLFFAVIVATILISLVLYHNGYTIDAAKCLDVLFHVVSIATTTGFSATEYSAWPVFCPILLLLLGVVGGCAGSTSGGIKVARVLMIFKHSIKEMYRLLHPRAHYLIKFNNSAISSDILGAVWGFIGLYITLFFVFLLLLSACNIDFFTAFSAIAATLSNIGPGLGEVAKNYQNLGGFPKLILCLSMITGRLEIFPMLILCTKVYWKN